MIEQIIYPYSRKDGEIANSLYFFNNTICKNGHYSIRYVNSGSGCKQCRIDRGKRRHNSLKDNEEYIKKRQEYNEKYREDNRKLINQKRKEKYHSNPEIEKQKHKEWAQQNKEYLSEYSKEWRKKNPSKYEEIKKRSKKPSKEQIRIYNRGYKKNNRGKIRALEIKREAAKRNAIPPWENNFKRIERLYQISSYITKITNIPHNVDHIIPIQGRANGTQVVCGLHTVDNLRIIAEEENLSKNAYSWPDMWNYLMDKTEEIYHG